MSTSGCTGKWAALPDRGLKVTLFESVSIGCRNTTNCQTPHYIYYISIIGTLWTFYYHPIITFYNYFILNPDVTIMRLRNYFNNPFSKHINCHLLNCHVKSRYSHTSFLLQQRRLCWFWHLLCMPPFLPVWRVYDFKPNFHGCKRPRGHPKTRGADCIKNDLNYKCCPESSVSDENLVTAFDIFSGGKTNDLFRNEARCYTFNSLSRKDKK